MLEAQAKQLARDWHTTVVMAGAQFIALRYVHEKLPKYTYLFNA